MIDQQQRPAWAGARLVTLAAVLGLLAFGTASVPGAPHPNPDTTPINSKPPDLADWQELYWRWAYGQVTLPPDANGHAVVGNVVLMPVPNAPGDGTPGSVDVTLDAGQKFFLPLWNLLGTSYTDGVTPPDPFVDVRVFKTLNLRLTLDGVPIVSSKDLMGHFSKFSFDPAIPINDFGIDSIIWLEGISILHDPLRPGAHVLKLDAVNTQPAFGLIIEYHNTWTITVLKEDLGNPGIFPPDSQPHGQTYSEWSAKWWQWGMEHPLAGHPFVDSPAFDVRSGQHGDVWFLAAPFGTVKRTVTIPEGKDLFVGLLNAEASDLEGLGATEAEQRDTAKFFADHIVNLSCTIDSKAVQNIGHYRVASPQFCFTAPTPWIFSPAPGGHGTSVADGYYLMLRPLGKGTHTIHYGGALHFSIAEGDPFDLDAPLDMTYHVSTK